MGHLQGAERRQAQSSNGRPSHKRPSGWETMINVLQVNEDETPSTQADYSGRLKQQEANWSLTAVQACAL